MTRKGTILSKITVEQEPGLTDTLVTAELDTTHTAPTFAELGVRDEIVRALGEQGIERTFAIQELTLPLALAGEDLIGQARTGMGKTFGFGVPLLHRVATADSGTTPLDGTPRALVIVPTRELCIQVTEDLERAGKYLRNHKGALKVAAIYGGRPYDSQIAALRDGVDVVVGTPGRLLDLAKQNHLILGKIGVLVLDEADEMLDLGFLPDIERILTMVPDQRQTMLFSATMPGPIITLARTFLTRPTHIRAEEPHDSAVHDRTAQFVYRAHALDKAELVARVLQAEGRGATMIFTRTKRTAQKVADDLAERGFAVGAVHGDLNQVQREKALDKFRKGAIDVLVATDVAARGIDIDDVTHVINYQCPEDEKTYVHRIGRTGRAGRTGVAVTLIDWDELNRWAGIDSALGLGIQEPVETYSRSPHLFTDLGIPEGVTGTVRKAPRVRETDAVVEERPARTPRKRNRKRTLRGKPVDESQNTENADSAAADDTAERVDASSPGPDTAGGDRADAGAAPARRRRRRRRGGSGANANTNGAHHDSMESSVATTQRDEAERGDSPASGGTAPRAEAQQNDAAAPLNGSAAQGDSDNRSVEAASVAAAASTGRASAVPVTESATAPETEAPRRRTRRRTSAVETAADTASTAVSADVSAADGSVAGTETATSAGSVTDAQTAGAATATAGTTVTADASVTAETPEATAPDATGPADVEAAAEAQAPVEPVKRAPRKRTTRAAGTETGAEDGDAAPRRRTRKTATADVTAEDSPAPRKRAPRKKVTAEAIAADSTATPDPASSDPASSDSKSSALASSDSASSAPPSSDSASSSVDANEAGPAAAPEKTAAKKTAAKKTAIKKAAAEKTAPRKTAAKKATAKSVAASAETDAAESDATSAEAATPGTAEANGATAPAAPRRRTRKAATAEPVGEDTPAPRKRAPRKKVETSVEAVETTAGSAASA